MSGYTYCGCRDCFEIAIGEPGEICRECKTAGCDPGDPVVSRLECLAPHAYGGHCGDVDCCGADPDEIDRNAYASAT